MSERNNFIDYIRIFCRSGHGGAGARHFMRNKLTAKGGPDGGDGGRGGHIILKGNTTAMYKAFVKNCFFMCPRQALHAKELGFVHPRTGEYMMFNSDLPQDILDLVDKWRKFINN